MILISKDYHTAVEVRMVKLIDGQQRGTYEIWAIGGADVAEVMARYKDQEVAEDAYLAILEDWQRGCSCHDMQHWENWYGKETE